MDEETNKRLGECLMEIANGNNEKLADVYIIMQRVFYTVGNVYFKRKEDIEDSIHDYLLVLLKKAWKFVRNQNAYAWIIFSYQNLCKNKRDRKKVETKYMHNQIEKIKNLSYASDIEFVDNNIFLKSVFDKLSRYEQKLLILYYWCDYTLNEIGTILKKPKSTIASQLNRIKAKISEDK